MQVFRVRPYTELDIVQAGLACLQQKSDEVNQSRTSQFRPWFRVMADRA